MRLSPHFRVTSASSSTPDYSRFRTIETARHPHDDTADSAQTSCYHAVESVIVAINSPPPISPRKMPRLVSRRLGRIGVLSVFTVSLFILWTLIFGGKHYHSKSLARISITLRQGTYIGQESDDENFPQVLEQWLGIPFGQSTAGERRFRAPLPMNASENTFEALDWGDRCPAGTGDGVPASENCLHVNIFRPKERTAVTSLPVLVHIFGGAFNFGAAHDRGVHNMVAWSESPFIGVSISYRVGALGFLPSSLTAEQGLLNAGLKDQELALQWVQENIAEFGGDPDDVTLMGPSAGAHSIGHHLLHKPDHPPPFARVIIESGGATARAVYKPTNPLHEQQFEEFLSKLGVEDMKDDKKLQALRYMSSNAIRSASESLYSDYNPSVRWPWQPVIDGPEGFIAEAPIDALRSGRFHRVPILTGFNTNEGAMFVPKKTATSEEFTSFFRTLLPGLSERDLKKLNEVYPDPLLDPASKYAEARKGVGAQYRRIEQAYGHFAYTAPVRQTAQYAALADVPVYLYHFALVSNKIAGSDHGSHQSFPTYSEDRRHISDTVDEVLGSMHAYWTSFITTGDPNKIRGRHSKRPHWPLYRPENGDGRIMVFGDGNDEVAGGKNAGVAAEVGDDDFAAEESVFWWERTEKFEW